MCIHNKRNEQQMRVGYHDIKTEVMNRIRQNIWPPGANVPGEIALAEEFGCARATVNRAMRELVEEGVLERKRKAGTRVRSSPNRKAQFAIPLTREEITANGAVYRYVLIKRETVPAPVWLCARMDIDPNTACLHLHCMHFADGRPYQFEDRWINLGAVPHAADADFEKLGPNEWLVQQVPYTEGQVDVSAAAADTAAAEHLGVALGSPVFLVERTTWLDAQSVTFARLHFPPTYKMTTRF
jgi:GntR family histidine utilization transcriptional repressor